MYLGAMNRSETTVDAPADTFVSFEDHAVHKASNLAVLTQLAASPEKRRAEEVLKTPRTQTVKFVASNPPPAMGTRAKKLAVLTTHLPTSSKAAAAPAASALKPPPVRPVLTTSTATKTTPAVTAKAPNVGRI